MDPESGTSYAFTETKNQIPKRDLKKSRAGRRPELRATPTANRMERRALLAVPPVADTRGRGFRGSFNHRRHAFENVLS